MAATGLSFENPLFSRFAFYAAVVLMKTAAMSLWTAVYRIRKQVFPSPEDYKSVGKTATTTPDPHVEIIRRCHQNDLENVFPFILVGLLYVLCEPDLFIATLHFRIFTASRLLHTIVYLNDIRQPARPLMFTVGFVVIASMLITVLASGDF